MNMERHSNIKQQIGIYKRRCEIMNLATNIGLTAVIFLILTLIAAAFDVVFPGMVFLKYVVSACAITGLILVIVGTLLVMQENSIIQQAWTANWPTFQIYPLITRKNKTLDGTYLPRFDPAFLGLLSAFFRLSGRKDSQAIAQAPSGCC